MVLFTSSNEAFILMIINIIGFGVTYYDKSKSLVSSSSIHRDRVSEKIFYFLVFLGSVIGVIFSIIFLRHKTIKNHFQFNLMISIIFHFCLVFVVEFKVCHNQNKFLGHIFLLLCILMMLIFLFYLYTLRNSKRKAFYLKQTDSVYLKINFQLAIITFCLWCITVFLNKNSKFLIDLLSNNSA